MTIPKGVQPWPDEGKWGKKERRMDDNAIPELPPTSSSADAPGAEVASDTATRPAEASLFDNDPNPPVRTLPMEMRHGGPVTQEFEPILTPGSMLTPPADPTPVNTPPSKHQQTVVCRFCGGEIPPLRAPFCSKQATGITCRP